MKSFYSFRSQCVQHLFGEQNEQSHESSIGGLVGTANFNRPKMLRCGRRAGLVRLHRSKGVFDERQEWAGSVRRRDRRPLGNHARFPVNSEPSHAVLPKVRLGRKCLAFGSELLGMAH
ncbi:hypothetical protein [Vannielia sp.]|uniref:hypothetical protein n=1 Tax=Vannielia sp. TaxID=2813045 RepID=UPI002606F702|nr:hypothetical protein [Vannielia sp.]